MTEEGAATRIVEKMLRHAKRQMVVAPTPPTSDPPIPFDPPFDPAPYPPFEPPFDPPIDPPFDPPFDPAPDPPFDPPFDPAPAFQRQLQ